MNDRPNWKPPKERPMWPWIVLLIILIGVTINVALTAG